MEPNEIYCPEYGIVLKEEGEGRGNYSADILSEYDKSEIVIPEEIDGMRIIGLKCLNVPNVAVRKKRLSRFVKYVQFGIGRFGGRFLEIGIDGENPYLKSDGKELYAKNGELIFFYAVGCKRLEALHIPHSVQAIGEFAFPITEAFGEITVDEHHPRFTAENGVLYSKCKTRLIFAPPCVVKKSFTVPDFVKKIGSMAFYDNPDLEGIILPPGVSIIEKEAFYGCHRLRRINFENVKLIEECAFNGCSDLTDIELFCDDLEALTGLFDVGAINESNAAWLIGVAAECHSPEFTAHFLELKNKRFPDPIDKFDLD